MSDIVQIGPWFFAVRPARNGVAGFMAWCWKTGELDNGPLVNFSVDVHAEFGATADEALAKLKREVLH